MIPSFSDYSEDALSKLLWQYDNSPNLRGLVNSTTTQLDSTQMDTLGIVQSFNVSTATGALLDLIGKIVGETRLGRTDDDYRDAIRFRTILNTSNGTPTRILEAIATTTSATKTRIWEHYPVSAIYYTNGSVAPQNLSNVIQEASPVTSGRVFIFSDPNENTFIPAELFLTSSDLVTHNNDLIVTHDDDIIEVFRQDAISENVTRGYLSEFTYGEGSGSQKDTPDGLGILCEII